jgi:hypothetical protein
MSPQDLKLYQVQGAPNSRRAHILIGEKGLKVPCDA